MHHKSYDEVKSLINNNINTLLTSEAGAGKTTLLRQVAEDLDLTFYSIAMTRQTTLNALLGFISINGVYIPSQLRQAVENGGMLLLDEIDAGDPNTLLCLNTLENDYLAFPDGIVETHKDFRLVATANPQDQHNIYTGRSKLDAATLDRFDVVEIERDINLEASLTSMETVEQINIMRSVLIDANSSKTVSMRDSIRYHKRKELGLDTNYVYTLVGEYHLVDKYHEKLDILTPPKPIEQSDLTTSDELWEHVVSTGSLSQDTTLASGYINSETGQATPYYSKNYTDDYVESAIRTYLKTGYPLPKGIKVEVSATPEDLFGQYVRVVLDDGRKFKFNKDEL